MFNKKLVFAILFACFVPVMADAGVGYAALEPADYENGSIIVYQKSGGGCRNCRYNYHRNNYRMNTEYSDENVWSSRNRRARVVEPVRNDRDWYVAANVALIMWSWENKYASDYHGTDLAFDSDDYSFEPVFGGSVAVGRVFGSGWRGDIELGLTSRFSDSDDVAKFSMKIPYLLANAYYDFDSGVYVGAGVGVANPNVKVGGLLFDGNTAKKSAISPKVGLALGYATGLTDRLYLDLRYRLSGMRGTKVSNNFLWDHDNDRNYELYYLQIKNGLILENAFSVGLRYMF